MEAKSIGKFIATLRKANGYTQAQLAEMLGVSNKTISNWENEVSYPDFSLIPVIADMFNVTSENIKNGRAKSLENALEIVRSKINEKCNTN